ncbi:MAG: sulfotransferase domain-containing protein [Anaerolineales bacterium]|nr:sulfotransferase domain-containing protein [Anaerolineales bacterium]
MKKLFDIFKKPDKTIYVVSGLPRSGTSMMMKMLEAGGLPPVTDNERTADDDNPKGYYEFERVKKMQEGDIAWVKDAPGKVVKVISYLIRHLPEGYTYKVIFMRRAMEEILASQKKMLINRGEPTDKVTDAELMVLYEKHLEQTFAWMNERPHFSCLQVDYNRLLKEPEPIVKQLGAFLGNQVNMDKMTEVVDPKLYRQRKN